MHPNEQLIRDFYTAFGKKDYRTMQECYAENASFYDPVFQDLDARGVRSMWEMLLKSAGDMEVEFRNITAGEDSGSAEWIARYVFSATGRSVENRIKATFRFEGGKIIKHTDDFSFPRWARQALGFSGLLLGNTGMLKNKVRKKARKNLERFMQASEIT